MAKLDARRMFGTSSFKDLLIHPFFISGFVDAEACFHIGIVDCSGVKTSSRVKSNWDIRPEFKIELNKKDLLLLNHIQKFFGGKGNISAVGNKVIYRVRSLKDLIEILSHFEKYPLITQKRVDLESFKQVVNLMANREHLTVEGLLKIVSIKASMNRGLSDKLKKAFPGINPEERPKFLPNYKEVLNPH